MIKKSHIYVAALVVILFMFVGNMFVALISDNKKEPFKKALEHFFFEVCGVVALCATIYFVE